MLYPVYLKGILYHMTHIDNLPSILYRRAILSKERVEREKISYNSIADENVQNRRDRIFIWDQAKDEYRTLHSYVPFYFNTYTPMLYRQYKRELQNRLLFFEVDRMLIGEKGVVFTDGNATNQQLSNHMYEEVDITPASSPEATCYRRYRPDGKPHGMNTNRSNFYCDSNCLKYLNWNIINDRWFNDEEKGRIKHAEVLIPDLVPLGKIHGIATPSSRVEHDVNQLIEKYGLTDRIPSAICKPNLFF